MLTRRHAIIRYDFQRRQAVPDRLTRNAHRHYLAYAARILDIYRRGAGQTRQQLHTSVERLFRHDLECLPRRIEAFCKLLDDRSEFDRVGRRNAAELRRAVFRRAASFHPLATHPESADTLSVHDVQQQIARELGRSWKEIEADLFADCIEYHRLRSFDSFRSPSDLLACYNIGQLQLALYDALSLTIWAEQDFKTILRQAKLAQLMHDIWRLDDGRYRIRLDGPASILRPTVRYGTAMARFLPSLLACEAWRMHAVLRPKRLRREFQLKLTSRDGFRSHQAACPPFDSAVERRFANDWGESRDGWRLLRESEILHCNQKVFLPDFVFQHSSGRRALMEVVGFWTEDYLQAKAKTLAMFTECDILLAVAASNARILPKLPGKCILYQKRIPVDQVMQLLPTSR